MSDNTHNSHPKLYLKSGETLLGTLEIYNSSWPWVYCTFEPTEAFTEIKPLLKAAEKASDEESFQAAWKEVKALKLSLTDLNPGKIVTKFWLSVRESVIFGTEIWLREFYD